MIAACSSLGMASARSWTCSVVGGTTRFLATLGSLVPWHGLNGIRLSATAAFITANMREWTIATVAGASGFLFVAGSPVARRLTQAWASLGRMLLIALSPKNG